MRLATTVLLLCLSFSSFANIDENLTIPQLHQQMQAGSLSSEALVKHYLNRIEQFDDNGPKLNSVVQINPNAIKEAKALDKKLTSSGLVGVLHGIPVLLKDNIDTADGMANTAGSYALEHNFPEQDAFLVTQLRNAGAIILGKANLSQWANFRSTASSSGWTAMYGQTKNPYDITRSPCGSSSGSGSAIAANLATVAIGTETDGSITCPSAVNGIVGYKPLLGTVSRSGVIPLAHSQDTAGPMTRNVTDAIVVLSAITAVDKQDTGTKTTALKPLQHLKKDGLKGKRIGIVRQLTGYHKGLDEQFEQAVADLKKQGAVIVDDLSFEQAGDWGGDEYQVLLYEFKHDIKAYLANTKDGLPKTLSELISFNKENSAKEMPFFQQEIFEAAEATDGLTSEDYKKALASSKQKTQEQGIDLLVNEHNLDVLIAPTTGPAWKIDLVNGDNFSGSATSAAAVSGYPHITVPMGYVHGLPVGLSFFTNPEHEGQMIEAGFAYEQATKHRMPPNL